MKTLFENRRRIDRSKLHAINTLDEDSRPQFIHSATYEQLTNRFGLSADALAAFTADKVKATGTR
jgi:hypothetical protein